MLLFGKARLEKLSDLIKVGVVVNGLDKADQHIGDEAVEQIHQIFEAVELARLNSRPRRVLSTLSWTLSIRCTTL